MSSRYLFEEVYFLCRFAGIFPLEMEEVANIVVYASGEYVEFSAMGMEMSFKTNKNIANLFE